MMAEVGGEEAEVSLHLASSCKETGPSAMEDSHGDCDDGSKSQNHEVEHERERQGAATQVRLCS